MESFFPVSLASAALFSTPHPQRPSLSPNLDVLPSDMTEVCKQEKSVRLDTQTAPESPEGFRLKFVT